MAVAALPFKSALHMQAKRGPGTSEVRFEPTTDMGFMQDAHITRD